MSNVAAAAEHLARNCSRVSFAGGTAFRCAVLRRHFFRFLRAAIAEIRCGEDCGAGAVAKVVSFYASGRRAVVAGASDGPANRRRARPSAETVKISG